MVSTQPLRRRLRDLLALRVEHREPGRDLFASFWTAGFFGRRLERRDLAFEAAGELMGSQNHRSEVTRLVAQRLVGGDHDEVSGCFRIGEEPEDQVVGRLALAEKNAGTETSGLRSHSSGRRPVEHDGGPGSLRAAELAHHPRAGFPIGEPAASEAQGVGQVVSIHKIWHE